MPSDEITGLPRIPERAAVAAAGPRAPTRVADTQSNARAIERRGTAVGVGFLDGVGVYRRDHLLRITVVVAMHVAEGAAWVRSLRWLSDLLTLPFVRRAVDTSMAGALLVRVVVMAPSPPVAVAASAVAQVDQTPESDGAAPTSSSAAHTRAFPADLQPGDILHVVRSGESLAFLGERYHGDPNAWKQIYADNRDRPQPDGGSVKEAGKITGWVLIIRNPTQTGRVRRGRPRLAHRAPRRIDVGDRRCHPWRRGPLARDLRAEPGCRTGRWACPHRSQCDLDRTPSAHSVARQLVSEPRADAPPENATTAPDPTTTPVASAAADHSDRA